MGFNCGIVGLPNVGKSTLFNALTETAAAEAANYPFCTIEPNTGRVAVPDPRLDALAALANSQNIIPTQLEFVDIAGLVRGASKGEGLGNQFLGNIREVDAIAHVLRCFDDGEVTHVDGDVDPVRDAQTVETELMLADIESLERRMTAVMRRSSDSISASINSVSTVCASRTGSTSPSTWVTSPSSKQRRTCAMASTSRILPKNWLPRPSPFDAPRTSPAISTNSSCVGIIF